MPRGSIGQILIQNGVIDAAGLADALNRQGGRHPVASELYALGYASERELCVALAQQTGWVGVVLDESAIRLDVLEYISPEWARIFGALVIGEDAKTIVVAAARPEEALVPARELAHQRGKQLEMRIALEITLARTIRLAFRAWKRGELFLAGRETDDEDAADGPMSGYLTIIQPDGDAAAASGGTDAHRQAQRALAEEASRDIESPGELPPGDSAFASISSEWRDSPTTTTTTAGITLDGDDDLHDLPGGSADQTMYVVAELDRGAQAELELGRSRALVVDPDAVGRAKIVGELERLGYECRVAGTGPAAMAALAATTFEVVFADIATEDLDGLLLCRAIKRSHRLAHTRVVVTTSVVDSGQVADDVLARAGADGYLEKPLDVRRLHRVLREALRDGGAGEGAADQEARLADALGRYHEGDLEGAMAAIRSALADDPASPKLHFMLANMLQRASSWAEAIDEYEAVVELSPAYFPALTRLAYLYFRQGLHARAVETWRRALPVCEDPALRRNIELFMRKLVADMTKGDTP